MTRDLGYRDRAAALLRCGFKSYQDYLASSLWQEIRVRVLRRDKGACRVCSRPAKQVHHTRYNDGTLLGHRLDELMALCRDCHRAVEFTATGRKVHHQDIKRRLKKRQKAVARRGGSR